MEPRLESELVTANLTTTVVHSYYIAEKPIHYSLTQTLVHSDSTKWVER